MKLTTDDKLGLMLLLFAEDKAIDRNLLNTKLFYFDLFNLFKHGKTYSGATYIKSDFGPKPDNIRDLVWKSVHDETIEEKAYVAGNVMFFNIGPTEHVDFDKTRSIIKIGCPAAECMVKTISLYNKTFIIERIKNNEEYKNTSWGSEINMDKFLSELNTSDFFFDCCN